MKKPITIALLRSLEKQLNAGEISYSRMVEILNEKAFEAYSDTIEGQVGFIQFNENMESADRILNDFKIDQVDSGKVIEFRDGIPSPIHLKPSGMDLINQEIEALKKRIELLEIKWINQ